VDAKELALSFALLLCLGRNSLQAANLQNLVATNLSHADYVRDDSSGTFQLKTALDIAHEDSTSCTTRFTSSLLGYSNSLPVGGFGNSGGAMTGYQISIDVLAAHGETWQLNVTNRRVGAITLVDRSPTGSASGTTDVSKLAFSGDGALSGSVDLDFVHRGIGEPMIPSGADVPFDQTASALVSGVGTGAPQTLTFQFTSAFPFIAWSSSNTGASDEAAVRMGIALDSGNATTAGSYPGVGARDLNGDGNFVTLTLVPEPCAASFVVWVGMLQICSRRRRRADAR